MSKLLSLNLVTRLTVVLPEGSVSDHYNAFPNGVELHLQDDGRTLKLFPIITDSEKDDK